MRSVKVVKASTLKPRTEIERRILAAIDDPESTFADVRTLYYAARNSDYNEYIKIDWGTLQIMMRTRWPNAMQMMGD